MEVIAGYKQTAVGVIPEDWSEKSIGSVCKIFGRIGFRGYTKKDIVELGKGAIAISPSNITDNKVDFSSCTYISWLKYEESPEIKIFNGDIILVKTGSTFGKTAIVKHLPEKATLNPQLVVLKNTTINNAFLAYMMAFPTIQGQISTAIVGGALPTLSQKLVAAFYLPVPNSPTEQKIIAEALTDVDTLIQSLEQLIEKKRNIKQGAMQELLRPKEGWSEKTIGCVLTIKHGKSQHAVEDNNGMYPILATGGQIGNSKQFLYDKPSVLIGRKGTIDRPQYMDQPFWTVDTLFYSAVNEPNNAKYIYYQFCLIHWKQYNEASGVPSLNAATIESIELKIPSPAEQTAIASILSDMDSEIAELEAKLAKTRDLKAGMMHELLTGRIRLI
jgi:type I restriction enzyme S subunit